MLWVIVPESSLETTRSLSSSRPGNSHVVIHDLTLWVTCELLLSPCTYLPSDFVVQKLFLSFPWVFLMDCYIGMYHAV